MIKKILILVVMIFIFTSTVEAKRMWDKKIGPGVTMTVLPDDGVTLLYLDRAAALEMIATHEGGARIFGVTGILAGVGNNFIPMKGVLGAMFGLAGLSHSAYASELKSKLSSRGLIIRRCRGVQTVISR